MGRKIGFLSIGLSLFLTGCHVNYDFHSRPINLECTDLEEKVEDAFSSNSYAVGELPCPAWWDFFNDPQLSTLIEAALESHPNIKMASARLRLAGEKALLSRSALYPHINFEADIFREKVSKYDPQAIALQGFPTTFKEAGLDLRGNFDLDLWNKNRSLFHSELDLVQAAAADRLVAELMLASAIAQVYFDLQGNLLRLEIAKNRHQNRKSLYDLISKRVNSGLISQFRLYETDAQIAQIGDLIYQIEAKIEINKHALAALIGNATGCCDPTGKCIVSPSGYFLSPFPLPCSLPLDLLGRRPEITAQKWRIQSKCYLIKAARAAFYPNVNLMGYIGYRGIKFSKLLQAQSLEYLGDASLSLPIFNAGQLQAELGIARENYEIVIEEYNQMILDAVQEVSDALTDLQIADDRLKNIKESLQDAEKLYELTDKRYQNGIENYLAVLNSQEDVWIQRDLEAQIQLARLKSAVALIRSIGGCYHE